MSHKNEFRLRYYIKLLSVYLIKCKYCGAKRKTLKKVKLILCRKINFGKYSNQCIFIADSGSESGSHKSIRDKRPSGPSDGKPTRVRTVLNEKQLHTLR